MIDEILEKTIDDIEREEKLHPGDHADVQSLLNDLKDQMRELIVFWKCPTLEQLERLEQTPCSEINSKLEMHGRKGV